MPFEDPLLASTTTQQKNEDPEAGLTLGKSNKALDAAGMLQLNNLLEKGWPPRQPELPCPTWGDPKDRWRYQSRFGLANDNLPPFMSGVVPADRRDGKYGDDDGRTMHSSFDQTLTNDARGLQFASFSSYEMLTQDGSNENPQNNLRADLMNNILQVNKRFDMESGLTFYAGLGVGAQTIGNMSGVGLQNWFHEKGGMGGRLLGHGLQDNYNGMTGSITRPALSGGVRLEASTHNEHGWNAGASVSASGLAGFGPVGMSSYQVGLNGEVGNEKIATLSGGVFVAGGHTNGSYLKFAPIEDHAVGYEAMLQLNLLRNLHIPVAPYVMLQSNGGGFADTTYTIGFVIGLGHGHKPWVKPPR